jgi:hypothetical protein
MVPGPSHLASRAPNVALFTWQKTGMAKSKDTAKTVAGLSTDLMFGSILK